MRSRAVLVAGLGNPYRGDDGVGALVAELVAEEFFEVSDVGPLDEPLDLLGRFDGADLVVVIDAVRSGAPVGTVRVLEVDTAESSEVGSSEPAVTSTHGIGLIGVLRLARAVGHAPRRLVVVAVEGGAFGLGDAMSDAVRDAVAVAASAARDLIREEQRCA